MKKILNSLLVVMLAFSLCSGVNAQMEPDPSMTPDDELHYVTFLAVDEATAKALLEKHQNLLKQLKGLIKDKTLEKKGACRVVKFYTDRKETIKLLLQGAANKEAEKHLKDTLDILDEMIKLAKPICEAGDGKDTVDKAKEKLKEYETKLKKIKDGEIDKKEACLLSEAFKPVKERLEAQIKDPKVSKELKEIYEKTLKVVNEILEKTKKLCDKKTVENLTEEKRSPYEKLENRLKEAKAMLGRFEGLLKQIEDGKVDKEKACKIVKAIDPVKKNLEGQIKDPIITEELKKIYRKILKVIDKIIEKSKKICDAKGGNESSVDAGSYDTSEIYDLFPEYIEDNYVHDDGSYVFTEEVYDLNGEHNYDGTEQYSDPEYMY